MIRVDTTDFSTPAWTRRGLDPVTPGPTVRPWRRGWTCLLAGVLLWCLMLAAPAMAREPEVLQSTVQRSADGRHVRRELLEPVARDPRDFRFPDLPERKECHGGNVATPGRSY